MSEPVESVDELCEELESLLYRAREGNVPAWFAADVLEETAEDIRAIGFIPPQWG